jgi:Leucine Rich repeat
MDSIVLGTTLVTVLVAVVVAGKLFIRWRHNRYRFSMRALLLAFAVVGCGLFAILRLAVPPFEHRWAIRQIHVSGATTRFPEDNASYEEKQKPGYQSSRDRRNYWRDVNTIRVSGDREAIAVAGQLTSIPELQSVDLFGITDVGLEAICHVAPHTSLELICLFDSHITGTGLSDSSDLKNVHMLFLNTCQIDDAALARFRSMPALRDLTFFEESKSGLRSRFTEKGFAEIGRIDTLQSLRLTDLPISDAAAGHLHNLKGLKTLTLNSCQISDPALEQLREALPDCRLNRYLNGTGLSETSDLSDVRRLALNTGQVDDAVLARIKSMPDLRELSLIDEGGSPTPSRLTNESFAKIGRLKSLEWLDLTKLEISDAAAQYLSGLTRLKTLYLTHCQISDPAVEELRKALPDCEVKCYGNEK